MRPVPLQDPQIRSPHGQTSLNRGAALAQKSPLPLPVLSSEPQNRGGGSAAGKPPSPGGIPQSRSPPTLKPGGGGAGPGTLYPGPGPHSTSFSRGLPLVNRLPKLGSLSSGPTLHQQGGQGFRWTPPLPTNLGAKEMEGSAGRPAGPGIPPFNPAASDPASVAPGACPTGYPLPERFPRTWHLGRGQGPPPTLAA